MSLQDNHFRMEQENFNIRFLLEALLFCTCHMKLIKFAFFAGCFCLQVTSSTCKDFF